MVSAVVERSEALAVDANGRFDAATALEYAEALGRYGLKWYEEPGDPLDYELLAEVARNSSTPIATGEKLFSLEDSRNLIRYGGLNPQRDFLQMAPTLSYGLTTYLRILQMHEEQGWSARRCIPHGGHQFSLHIAAGLGLGGNESYPEFFSPSEISPTACRSRTAAWDCPTRRGSASSARPTSWLCLRG